MEPAANYKPSAFYYRQALRSATTKAEAVALGLHLVEEIELQKQWIRVRGMVPPKWFVMPSERAAKDWGSAVPFPSRESESETEE